MKGVMADGALMAELSPSGELLLASLLDFAERKEHEIGTGKVTLNLHPRALEYLASRLQVLEELDRLRQSAPVDFFRGAFTDLDDYTRLQKLQHLLARARRVCVNSTVCHLRDPTRVNLLPFQSLSSMELRGCDLSTSVWLGLANIQTSLQGLTCIGSLEELHHLLAPYSRIVSLTGERGTSVWPQLTSLCCKQNSFEDMDSSLHLLLRLHAMDLSNNNISVIRNLHHCSCLVDLNLSYNNIESLSPLRECGSHLVRLVLQGNAIRSIQGLQTLTSLTELDLRGNLLASYQEFSRLKELTDLRSLWLEGNPLAYAPFYRLDVLAWFDTHNLRLDGVQPQSSEATAVALRAAGEVPYAWHIMAQYVSQQELLWRPRQVAKPRSPGVLWRAASVARSPFGAPPHRRPSSAQPNLGVRRAPARRIVDFSGDPLAALDSALDRPPSPSPFLPAKEDAMESSSQASSVSGARLPMLRSTERLNQAAAHAVYRSRTADQTSVRPTSDVPAYADSILDSLQSLQPPPQPSGEGEEENDSDDSSSLGTSVSSRAVSMQGSPSRRAVLQPSELGPGVGPSHLHAALNSAPLNRERIRQ